MLDVVVVMDPIGSIKIAKDSTFAMLLEAQRRGHRLLYVVPGGLSVRGGVAGARVAPLEVRDEPGNHYKLGTASQIELGPQHVVLMRKDPPVDIAYLHATWILDHARGKTLLVNDPRGLRELNEHLAVLQFPHLTPPTIVTRSTARLKEFQAQQGGAIVVKPVDGYGGLGIFVVRDGDPNASSILETSTGAGTRWTLAQAYLPAAVEGDKRIILADGEPVGAVLRVPASAEARGNLHVGGRAVKTEVDARDKAIIAEIAPWLKQHGQILVGLDVIGGMLTEINITSPTGVRHISRLDDRNVAEPIMDCFERLSRGIRG